MQGQLITAALTGPMLVLALYQLFGVSKLFSVSSLKIFLWGLGLALLSYPALALIGVVGVEQGRDTLFLMVGQSVRIWLFLFGMAVVGRWGLAICRWLWSKRPVATRYEPGRDGDATR